MQTTRLSKMEFSSKIIARFVFDNSDNNLIGNKGCEFLSQANWPSLSVLNLSKNQFQSEGIKYLAKSNWTLLKIIKLGIILLLRFQSIRK